MTKIEIVPTGAALGAEVRGIDLSADIGEEAAKTLKTAWHENLVLLLRDQQLDDDALLRASQIFGPLQEGGARRYFREGGFEEGRGLLSRHPEITVISNLDEEGNPVRENAGLGSGEVVWHSDNSYVEVPPTGSLLHAYEVPSKEYGGATSFNNQYLAYETLSDDLKGVIEGKHCVHDDHRNTSGLLRPTRGALLRVGRLRRTRGSRAPAAPTRPDGGPCATCRDAPDREVGESSVARPIAKGEGVLQLVERAMSFNDKGRMGMARALLKSTPAARLLHRVS